MNCHKDTEARRNGETRMAKAKNLSQISLCLCASVAKDLWKS